MWTIPRGKITFIEEITTITLTMDRSTHTLRGAEAAALGALPNYSTPDAAGARPTETDRVPPSTAGTPQTLQRESSEPAGVLKKA